MPILPTNSGLAKARGCSPVSSNCVVWQGPDLSCIDLCKGDSVSEVIANLATELCSLLDMFDLQEFDFSCLELQPSESPENAGELLQILIDRICILEGLASPGTPTDSSECPDNCIVPIADCFYYINQFGDTVTTMSLSEYVLTIGNRICSILDDISNLQSEVETLQDQVNGTVGSPGVLSRLTTVEEDKVDENELQYQVNVNTDPSAGTIFITDALRSVENSLLSTQNALGSSTELYQNMLKAGNISSEEKLFGNGSMNSIVGWTGVPQKNAESFGNLWLAIHDIRSAINYIQENCCSSSCSDIYVNLRADIDIQMPSTFLTIFVDGSTGFTPEWAQCQNNTRIVITDALGNSSTLTMNLLAYINSPAGFQVDITPTSIDPSQDITIVAETCFINTATEASCTKDYSYTIRVTPNCPSTVLTIYSTAIAYQFPATPGYMYNVNVYYAGGVTPVASQVISTPGILVSNSIFSLLSSTDYELEIVMIDSSANNTTCPRQAFTTLPDNCVPPINPIINLTT